MTLTPAQYKLLIKALVALIDVAILYHKLSSGFRGSSRREHGDELRQLKAELIQELEKLD